MSPLPSRGRARASTRTQHGFAYGDGGKKKKNLAGSGHRGYFFHVDAVAHQPRTHVGLLPG